MMIEMLNFTPRVLKLFILDDISSYQEKSDRPR